MPEEEDSDEDDYIYNPLKLPMGPDGKPIPYWLYKLHGLNQARPRCLLCRLGQLRLFGPSHPEQFPGTNRSGTSMG